MDTKQEVILSVRDLEVNSICGERFCMRSGEFLWIYIKAKAWQ